MQIINQNFSVSFHYPVLFTESLFDPENRLFADTLKKGAKKSTEQKVLFVFDEEMHRHHPDLFNSIRQYHSGHTGLFSLVPEPVIIPGGEDAKNDPALVDKIVNAINEAAIDRHSWIAVIGGGAVVDTVGYAAAIAHRGVRLIRIPTTVLAQNDASIGVKNGVNAYGKKNFLGTFVPPYAVLNDRAFLKTLDHRDWVSGISEAVKVALIKDAAFFEFIEQQAELLKERDMDAMQKLIFRCAELHLEHIAGSGDPFENGSSRPLDFGHWAAHKLEQISSYRIKHGEAVAIGIALDSAYSFLTGQLEEDRMIRIFDVLKACGFRLYVPELKHQIADPEQPGSILHGLEEFREHLGGELTIMLLKEIGKGIEVHEADHECYRKAVDMLQSYEEDVVVSHQ